MLPDFVVIGGMKCGTTALWRYLRQHPGIHVPPNRKNLNFFLQQDNWSRGLDWYESFFAGSPSDVSAIGEVSTEYTKYPFFPGVPEKLSQVLPKAKLVYLVRHPIRRIVSQYLHLVNAGTETRTFDEAIRGGDPNPYLRYSQYYYQLEQFFPFFPQNAILVLTAEKLRREPALALDELARFVGAAPGWRPSEEIVVHTRAEKRNWNRLGRRLKKSPELFRAYQYYSERLPPPLGVWLQRMTGRVAEVPAISPDTRRYLLEVLQPDVERLQEFLGSSSLLWALDEF